MTPTAAEGRTSGRWKWVTRNRATGHGRWVLVNVRKEKATNLPAPERTRNFLSRFSFFPPRLSYNIAIGFRDRFVVTVADNDNAATNAGSRK